VDSQGQDISKRICHPYLAFIVYLKIIVPRRTCVDVEVRPRKDEAAFVNWRDYPLQDIPAAPIVVLP
jgi:hypothetical protein